MEWLRILLGIKNQRKLFSIRKNTKVVFFLYYCGKQLVIANTKKSDRETKNLQTKSEKKSQR